MVFLETNLASLAPPLVYKGNSVIAAVWMTVWVQVYDVFSVLWFIFCSASVISAHGKQLTKPWANFMTKGTHVVQTNRLTGFTEIQDFYHLTTITTTPFRFCRGFTRSSPSQLSGQIDKIRADTPTPWWADRYHSRAERNLTHPGEVCLSPRLVVRVCSRQQGRQAALSSL